MVDREGDHRYCKWQKAIDGRELEIGKEIIGEGGVGGNHRYGREA